MVSLQDISKDIIRFSITDDIEERDLGHFLSRVRRLFPEENLQELSLCGARISNGKIEYIEYAKYNNDKAKKL